MVWMVGSVRNLGTEWNIGLERLVRLVGNRN